MLSNKSLSRDSETEMNVQFPLKGQFFYLSRHIQEKLHISLQTHHLCTLLFFSLPCPFDYLHYLVDNLLTCSGKDTIVCRTVFFIKSDKRLLSVGWFLFTSKINEKNINLVTLQQQSS